MKIKQADEFSARVSDRRQHWIYAEPKRVSFALLIALLDVSAAALMFGCSRSERDPVSTAPGTTATQPETPAAAAKPTVTLDGSWLDSTRIGADHQHMRELLANAFRYVAPENGIIDPASGYPFEGWNQDPERGLFLRSFTQLTAVGEWIELLANIAAGYADNPYISRDEALQKLAFVVKSMRQDQHDPQVSAKGLLGNFLGLEGGRRIGPLARDLARQDVIDAFGQQRATALWAALAGKDWIVPESDGQSAVIERGEKYGWDHFDGPLAPYSDEATKRQLMEVMDQRIVMVAYGDNANLASSVAKAIGALLRPEVRDDPTAARLREEMEQMLDDQQEGYEFLFDQEAGMFRFGWNASTDRYFGWEDLEGNWKIGHSDYLVNEFRGPTMFVQLRYGMPGEVMANLGFKTKSYRLQDGQVVHTLAPWEGSAFQALGLSLSMGELENPAWRTILENVVKIELDYADRHGLPGFLSESYSGEGTQYTGSVGIPEIAVNSEPRITDAPSLYTLGVAYTVAPDQVEQLLKANWQVIRALLTDHGPCEGYNTTKHEAIEFQTSAHVLTFILGALGTASENMARYLDSKGLGDSLAELYRPGDRADFLSPDVKIIGWSPDGSRIDSSRNDDGFHVKGADVGEVGVTFDLAGQRGVNLSSGLLTVRYRVKQPIEKASIKLEKKDAALDEAGVIPTEILTSFAVSDGREEEMSVPLPATPGLAGIKQVVILCGSTQKRVPLDLSITGFEFLPFETTLSDADEAASTPVHSPSGSKR